MLSDPSNTSIFRQLLAERFPSLNIRTCNHIRTSWDADVYHVNETYIFRRLKYDTPKTVFEEAIGLHIDMHTKIATEVALVQRLSGTISTRLPSYDYVSNDSQDIVIGYQFIPGETLIHSPELERGANTGIVHDITQFLSELHTFPLEETGDLPIVRFTPETWHTLCVEFYQFTQDTVAALLDQATLIKLQRLWQQYLQDETNFSFTPTLIHRDFAPSNILVDPTTHRLTGVIDWGGVCIGDPAFDFTSLFSESQRFGEQVLAFYQHEDPYLRQRIHWYTQNNVFFMLLDALNSGDQTHIDTVTQQLHYHITTLARTSDTSLITHSGVDIASLQQIEMTPPEQSAQPLYRLYAIPDLSPYFTDMHTANITVRRASARDLSHILQWAECDHLSVNPALLIAAFTRLPVSGMVIEKHKTIIGCCLYNLDQLGTVGPLMMASYHNTIEIQSWLLSVTLRTMFRDGYQYAITAYMDHMPTNVLFLSCATPLRDVNNIATASERDVVEYEWADLFLPLQPTIILDEGRIVTIKQQPIMIRRPAPSELQLLVDWVREEFGRGFASELQCAFIHEPIACLIAVHQDSTLPPTKRLLGFVGYDCSARGITGPLGVHTSMRGSRLVDVLVRTCVHEMALRGYEYAILGGYSQRHIALWAFPQAWTIPGSYPGWFANVIAYT